MILIAGSLAVIFIAHMPQEVVDASFILDRAHSVSMPPRLEHIIVYKNIVNDTSTTITLQGLLLKATIEPTLGGKYNYVVIKSRGIDIYVTLMSILSIIVYIILWEYVLRELEGRAKTITTIIFLVALILALVNILIASTFSSIPYSIVKEQKGVLHLLNPAGTLGRPLLPRNYTMYLFKEYIDTEKIMVFESNKTSFILVAGTKNYTQGIEMNPSKKHVIVANESFVGKKIYILILVPSNEEVNELIYKEASFYKISNEIIEKSKAFVYFITPTIYSLAIVIAVIIKKNKEYYIARINKRTTIPST